MHTCCLFTPYPQVLAAKAQCELVKADREQAQTDVLAHGRVMAKLKREEVEAAERITEDHVHACDRGKSLGEVFPSIQASRQATSCQRECRALKTLSLICDSRSLST